MCPILRSQSYYGIVIASLSHALEPVDEAFEFSESDSQSSMGSDHRPFQKELTLEMWLLCRISPLSADSLCYEQVTLRKVQQRLLEELR
jgi:hypothetical protein